MLDIAYCQHNADNFFQVKVLLFQLNVISQYCSSYNRTVLEMTARHVRVGRTKRRWCADEVLGGGWSTQLGGWFSDGDVGVACSARAWTDGGDDDDCVKLCDDDATAATTSDDADVVERPGRTNVCDDGYDCGPSRQLVPPHRHDFRCDRDSSNDVASPPPPETVSRPRVLPLHHPTTTSSRVVS